MVRSHGVQSAPEAKGKIERRFGTLQKRLVALLAYEQVSDYPAAQVVLDRQLAREVAARADSPTEVVLVAEEPKAGAIIVPGSGDCR